MKEIEKIAEIRNNIYNELFKGQSQPALIQSIKWHLNDLDNLLSSLPPSNTQEQGEDWKEEYNKWYNSELPNGSQVISWMTRKLDSLQQQLSSLKSKPNTTEAVSGEAVAIVTELANWSLKYPRGRIYGASRQPEMDGQLIALEERAKEWLTRTPSTQRQQQ